MKSSKIKAVFLLILFLFLFLSTVKKVFAVCITSYPNDYCHQAGVYPTNYCCNTSGGCSNTNCGTINQWQYCYASECCYEVVADPYDTYRECKDNCKGGECFQIPDGLGYQCHKSFGYKYQYTSCNYGDSCVSYPELRAGTCSPDTGCQKGGRYKLCCEYDTVLNDFTGNKASCSGANYSGVCPTHSAPNKIYATVIPSPFTTNCPMPGATLTPANG